MAKEHVVSAWMSDHSIMSPHHPDNPMAWPLLKKIYTSAASFFFTFTLLNSLTSYAAGIEPVSMAFGVSMTKATLAFCLFLFGVLFAPLYTPHVSERIGRSYIYFVCTGLMSAFLLGAGFSQNFTSFAVCRFFAGFCGGPIVVNVEGTFADIWSPRHTVTYYSFLAAAQYLGASVGMIQAAKCHIYQTANGCTGPIILGPVLGATSDWRYTQFIPLMFALASLLFGVGMPETYVREIVRRDARQNKTAHNLPPAASGESIQDMARYTIIDPLIMLVSEPLVIVSALLVGTAFAVTFSLFTAVPSVLKLLYMYEPYTAGLGFLSGLGGSIAGLISAIALEQLVRPIWEKKIGMLKSGVVAVEYRLVPGVFGAMLMLASLFWIGFTSKPDMAPIVPITGTAFFVWGSIMIIVSCQLHKTCTDWHC